MEINFNPSQIPQAEPAQPVVRQADPPPTSDTASFASSDSLKNQLDQISTARPDQVARAKLLVSNGDYPPDYVLNRIAVLLAIQHLGSGQSNSSNGSSQ